MKDFNIQMKTFRNTLRINISGNFDVCLAERQQRNVKNGRLKTYTNENLRNTLRKNIWKNDFYDFLKSGTADRITNESLRNTLKR